MGFTCLSLEYKVQKWSWELSSPYQSPSNYVKLRLIKTSNISSILFQNYSPTLLLCGKAPLKLSSGQNVVQINLFLSISPVYVRMTSAKGFNLFWMAAFSAAVNRPWVVKLSIFLSFSYFAEVRLSFFEGLFWRYLKHLGESLGSCFLIWKLIDHRLNDLHLKGHLNEVCGYV
jgi:hypothetical protein